MKKFSYIPFLVFISLFFVTSAVQASCPYYDYETQYNAYLDDSANNKEPSCIVTTEDEGVDTSDSEYECSIRYFLDQARNSAKCPVRYPDYEPSIYQNWIQFDTAETEYEDNDQEVRKITFTEKLVIDVFGRTVLGNLSYYAATDSSTGNLYDSVDEEYIDALSQSYDRDGSILKDDEGNDVPYDDGYVIYDFRSNFEAKDSDDPTANLPAICQPGTDDIYVRNGIASTNGYSLSEFMGGYASADYTVNNECIKDGGAFYVCSGFLLGHPREQGSRTSGATADFLYANMMWCLPALNGGVIDPGDDTPTDADSDGFDSDDDCDDSNSLVNPDATEVCDGVDNNCDGRVDESSSSDVSTWYLDMDGDGYGDQEYSGYTACNAPSSVYVANNDDCDDDEDTNNPDASESCDDVDNDCNGDVDDGAGCSTPTATDQDGDGFDAESEGGEDCDDGDEDVNPDEEEICDGIDNDCDGEEDEDDVCADIPDEDGDGFNANLDCNDFDDDVNPDADELCDNDEDDNCDNEIDENDCLDDEEVDEDGDGFTADEDCDDDNANVNPDQIEVCGNSRDDNCDGDEDESGCANQSQSLSQASPGCSLGQGSQNRALPSLVLMFLAMLVILRSSIINKRHCE